MKTVGIVGGLGPESTIDYYKLIISRFRERVGEDSYPQILLISLDVQKALKLVNADDLRGLALYFANAIEKLAAGGADFAILSANTPHIVFDALRKVSPLPLISIVEVTCDEAKRRGLKTVSLLGTRFTMSGRFYPEVFERNGIRLVPPSTEEQAYIHDKYVNELVNGIFLPETRTRLIEIIGVVRQREGIDAVVLAGTELPLLIREDSINGVPLLDTTRIHVDAIVSEILS